MLWICPDWVWLFKNRGWSWRMLSIPRNRSMWGLSKKGWRDGNLGDICGKGENLHYLYKRKEGGEWWEAWIIWEGMTESVTSVLMDWSRRSDRTAPSYRAEGGAEKEKGALYHSIHKDGALLSPRSLPHFNMHPVPPLLLLLVRFEPVLLLRVHKGSLQCGLCESSGPLWQGEPKPSVHSKGFAHPTHVEQAQHS